MRIKQTIRSILQVTKSIFIVFIPLYWLKELSSKFYQLNPDGGGDLYYDLYHRVPDDYKRSDVNNEARGAIRAYSILLTMLFASLGIVALIVPVVGMAWGVHLGLIVGVTIMPKIGDMVAKQTIRAMSWIQHRDDPQIINPTYPKRVSGKSPPSACSLVSYLKNHLHSVVSIQSFVV